MADDLTQGKDAAWWQQQWANLKQEVDVLNPKLDAVNAKLQATELQLANANTENSGLKVKLEQEAIAHQASLFEHGATIAGHVENAANLSGQIVNHLATIGELTDKNSELQKSLTSSQSETQAAKQLAEKRRLSLAEVMRLVAAVHEKITPLIAE